ncbi:MAG: NAD-dependent epimerase/dehydratase family protein [Planctomycetota bacterium]|nr:NAD-dependent epimerase/dehydratase family protein [Planctomycetota bacterium]
MKALVIGGTGFMGRFLCRDLAAAGWDVAVFHRGSTQAPGLKARRIEGDAEHLRDYRAPFAAEAPEVVVSMIAQTQSHGDALVDSFRGIARRLVVIGSCDVYRAYGRLLGTEPGPPDPVPLDESAPLREELFPLHEAFGIAAGMDKILVERAIMGHADLPATVLRLPMVHGPGDRQHRLHAYLKRMDDRRPAILLNALKARWISPRGYVENVAAAIALVVRDERAARRTYNVAEAPAYSEADWVRAVGAAVGWHGRILSVPSDQWPAEARFEQDLDVDGNRIRRELEFHEPVSFEEGLARTIAWERANPPTEIPEGAFDYAGEDRILRELNAE